MNAIREFIEEPSVKTGWEVCSVTAEACERLPRALQYATWLMAAMHPKGMRCPLLWQSRLTAGRTFHALHHFREAAHVWVGINDCVEVFAGMRFCHCSDSKWEQGWGTCEDCCAFGSGFLRVIWVSGWFKGSVNQALGWCVIVGEVGEPFCEMMEHCRRWKQCQYQQGDTDHRPMCAVLGCETAFRMLEEVASAEGIMPVLAFCSVAGFLYQESKPHEDDE